MAVDPKITILLDFYGEMLTEKERETLDLYYNDDLSLGEIADNIAQTRRLRRELSYGDETAERETITRQGVRDTIKRAEAKLIAMEEKLGLVERFARLAQGLDDIVFAARSIEELNSRTIGSREVTGYTDIIVQTAEKLKEES